MNIKIKMLTITLICLILTFSLPICSNALSFDDIFNAGKNFLNQGDDALAPNLNDGSLASISKSVSNILLTIALVVTFLSIAVMGVNFAIQTVEEKAKIKEAMVPWLIGIVISFGAYGIWKFVMNMFYNIGL